MTTYKTYNGQSFFDIAMHQYGDASMAVHVAIAAGVAVSDQPAGEVALPDGTVKYNVVKSLAARNLIPATWETPESEPGSSQPTLSGNASVNIEDKTIYKAYNGQSFFDIAMYQYGDASMAIHIALAGGLSATSQPVGNVKLPTLADDVNMVVVRAITSRGIIPATWLTDEQQTDKGWLWWSGYLHPDDYLHPDTRLHPGQ